MQLILATLLLAAACGIAPFFPYYAMGAVLLTMLCIALTVGTLFLAE